MRIVIVLLVALAINVAFPGEGGPTDVVFKFYATYQSLGHIGGLPPDAELAKLAPFFTPRLRGLIAGARRVQTEFARDHPDEKPPFVDGDMFSSLFEGFTTFEVGRVTKLPHGAYRVEVRFSHRDEAHATAVTSWKDAVLLLPSQGSLKIDDFEFLGEWPFAQKGRLSDILREVQ